MFSVGKPNAYVRGIAERRYAATVGKKLPDDAVCVTFTVHERAPWGNTTDWSPVTKWVLERNILIYTWSAFTGEWRREYVLTRDFTDAERVEMKLVFS